MYRLSPEIRWEKEPKCWVQSTRNDLTCWTRRPESAWRNTRWIRPMPTTLRCSSGGLVTANQKWLCRPFKQRLTWTATWPRREINSLSCGIFFIALRTTRPQSHRCLRADTINIPILVCPLYLSFSFIFRFFSKLHDTILRSFFSVAYFCQRCSFCQCL